MFIHPLIILFYSFCLFYSILFSLLSWYSPVIFITFSPLSFPTLSFLLLFISFFSLFPSSLHFLLLFSLFPSSLLFISFFSSLYFLLLFSLFPSSVYLLLYFSSTILIFPSFIFPIFTASQKVITPILQSDNIPTDMEAMRHTQILRTTVGNRRNAERKLEAWMDQSLPFPVSTHQLGHNNFRLNEHERKLGASADSVAESSSGEE